MSRMVSEARLADLDRLAIGTTKLNSKNNEALFLIFGVVGVVMALFTLYYYEKRKEIT